MHFPFREAERNIFHHEIVCNQWIQYGRKRTAVAELEVSGDFVPGETGVPAAEIYDYILDSVRVVEDGQEEPVELIPELCTSCEEYVINVLGKAFLASHVPHVIGNTAHDHIALDHVMP